MAKDSSWDYSGDSAEYCNKINFRPRMNYIRHRCARYRKAGGCYGGFFAVVRDEMRRREKVLGRWQREEAFFGPGIVNKPLVRVRKGVWRLVQQSGSYKMGENVLEKRIVEFLEKLREIRKRGVNEERRGVLVGLSVDDCANSGCEEWRVGRYVRISQ